MRIAQDAFEHVLGTRPVLTRSGGSIPVVAALGARGVPAIVTGFARPTAQIHSPNEHIPVGALRDGLDDDGRAAAPARGAWLTPATRARSPSRSRRSVLERFLRYVVIDTQAEVDSPTYPSTREAARPLRDSSSTSSAALGLADVELTEPGYVFATLPGTVDGAPTVGLIAHVDTTPGRARARASARSSTAPGPASRSGCRATRRRCSIRQTCPPSPSGSGRTSSRATARRSSAQTTRRASR